MKVALVITSIVFFSMNVSAKGEGGCKFGNDFIAVGESIFARDPGLVKEMVKALKKDGLSIDDAKERALRSDWTGYTLVCTESVKKNKSTTSGIETTDHVLVVGDNYSDYYREVMKKRSGK